MNSFDVDKHLKTLAKSNKYQTLYACSKEGTCFIFNNTTDYTGLQIHFLNLLNSYHNIYTDIALKEVDEIVITDDIYEDAYLYWKHKQRNKEFDKIKDNTPKSEKAFTWVFKKKPKE